MVEKEGPPAGSIRVKQSNREEKLQTSARILMTRIYDVQRDVKAKEFGYLASDSESRLEEMFNQLNPSSTVTIQRPEKKLYTPKHPHTSVSRTTPELELPTESKSNNAAGDNSEEDLPIASSSSDASDVPDSSVSLRQMSYLVKAKTSFLQLPSQMYRPNDDVALLTGKDASSPSPYFIRCRINTARLRRNILGKVVWVYTLKYPDHDGEYLGEACFEDRFLMPI